MTITADPLALLDLTFDPELGALLDAMPEEGWWWQAAYMLHEVPAWSAIFLHDVISGVDGRGFPWVVCGNRRTARWFQVFGEPEACTVELSVPGITNDMMVLGIPGGGSERIKVYGGEHILVVERRQVLTLAAAHLALDSWVLGPGTVPEGFDAVRVHN